MVKKETAINFAHKGLTEKESPVLTIVKCEKNMLKIFSYLQQG